MNNFAQRGHDTRNVTIRHAREERQAQALFIVRFSVRKVATAIAKTAIPGLQVHGNIVHLRSDSERLQPIEDLSPSPRSIPHANDEQMIR